MIATKYQQQEKQQEEDKEQHEIQDPLAGLIQQRLCYYRVFYKLNNYQKYYKSYTQYKLCLLMSIAMTIQLESNNETSDITFLLPIIVNFGQNINFRT